MRMTTIALASLLVASAPASAQVGEKPSGGREPRTGKVFELLAGNVEAPVIRMDEHGTTYMVYVEGGTRVMFATMPVGRWRPGRPVLVADVPGLSKGMRRGPRLAIGEKSIVTTWVDSVSADLHAAHSTDAGATWSKPVRVNQKERSAGEALTDLASAPDGPFYATWLDGRDKGANVYLAQSTDGGANWAESGSVYLAPEGSVCECCNPSIAAGRDGHVAVSFRNNLAGNRDVYVVESRDGGKTLTPASKQDSAYWKLAACPMDGGSIVVCEDDRYTVCWRRQTTLYVRRAGGPELKLAVGSRPWLSPAGDRTWLVWQGTEPAGIHAAVTVPETTKLDQHVVEAEPADCHFTDPVVAASPDGKFALAVWASQLKDKRSLRACWLPTE